MYAYFEDRRDNAFACNTTRGLTFPMHLHPQAELFFALHGETDVTVRGETQTLLPGTLAVIFPNQIHSYEAKTPDSRALLVICDLSFVGGFSESLLRQHPENAFLPPETLHPDVVYALGALSAETGARETNRAVYAPLVQLVLARVLPTLSLTRNRSADFRELTYQIAQFVAEHYAEPLTLDTLSKHLGVSRFHLSHVFSEKIGQHFTAYLSSIRLDAACGLLRDTDRSVTDVAVESGFESQRTFFRAFRARYGTTPSAYRRAALKS